MAEESSNVTKTVGFVSVNGEVVVLESLFKRFVPDPVEFAETFSDETIERRIRPLLGATFDNHVT